MSRFRVLLLFTGCLALGVTLGACGGSDDGGGGSADEDDITAAIETSSTSTDPADCAKYETDNALEQLEFTDPGETGLQSCEADAPDRAGNPDSVEVSDISVDGDTATASVTFTGGTFDGSTLDISLVKEGDQWKIDSLDDIPDFDLAGTQAAIEEAITANPDVPPEAAQCVVDAFSAVTEDELKQILIDGDDEAFFALLAPCSG